MNNQETILQDQLRRQSEPFDALWACRTRISDGTHLAPLRTHALRVLRVVSSLSGGGVSPAWDGVYHNLHQALSLQSVGLYTDVFNESMMCSSARDYDNAVSDVKERFVAGQLVFQGAWNAFEIAGEALFLRGKKPTSQAVRHKLERFGHQPIFGLNEAMFEAHSRACTYINTQEKPFKEAIAAGSYLGISAELLRQFRNDILHGKIQSLEPRDWEASDDKTCHTQTELFHAQIRLVLFLLQAIIARVEANHEVWFNEGDLVEELIFSVQKEIPEDAVDHTEEETDMPGLFMDQKFIHYV
ncbi:hypothetical protein [Pontivivens nitratireducens]|uniref:Uncharacterized protein n=1 Tax=Pontivivens nitratireducens TaxID=2758038 RepID=A0A6G7VQZ0_9RHOB|nr:hypothetical protein [Pontibrevibacter nitratireducens]QIK42414.1 hypothetical protein G8E03_16340 [Pontibrevibacter nitratireducens]